MKKTIGVFGGAFDPPHIAHSFIISVALTDGIDKLLVVPSANHPYHKQMTDFSIRMEMCRKAFSFFRNVEISDIENSTELSGYTYDTLDKIQSIYPDYNIVLYIGSDNSYSFENWYRYSDLKSRWQIREIKRGLISSSEDGISLPQISSSYIRRMISRGQSPGDFIAPDVKSLILKHSLYKIQSEKTAGIIGFGRVGESICHFLEGSHIRVDWILTPHHSSEDYIQQSNSIMNVDIKNVDYIFLCTPDNITVAIEDTHALVLSVSGAVPWYEKTSRDARGCLFHPAAPVHSHDTDLSKVKWVFHSHFASETEINFLKHSGFSIVFLESEPDYSLYHSACNAVANLSKPVFRKSMDILSQLSGVSIDILTDLMCSLSQIDDKEYFVNLFNSAESVISGPLIRKDFSTIKKHLHALNNYDPSVALVYSCLIKAACISGGIILPSELEPSFEKKQEIP
ncbi:MAG: DUF2520 domain-containing protein [Deltaproteobacteria bacterium]|nr:DUF2520 domain-containing protein [Deltaproteobacteria bacterium]